MAHCSSSRRNPHPSCARQALRVPPRLPDLTLHGSPPPVPQTHHTGLPVPASGHWTCHVLCLCLSPQLSVAAGSLSFRSQFQCHQQGQTDPEHPPPARSTAFPAVVSPERPAPAEMILVVWCALFVRSWLCGVRCLLSDRQLSVMVKNLGLWFKSCLCHVTSSVPEPVICLSGPRPPSP